MIKAITYGRGAASVGEQIGKSKEEAQDIINKFFKSFPDVKKWIDNSIEDAHKYGYVSDVAGRRRRLPDAQLPKYDIKNTKENNVELTFNPILGCSNRIDNTFEILKGKYEKQLNKIRNRKEYEVIQKTALSDGIDIHDNTGFIAQAERQAVNSRIQGSAASLTKAALIDIYYDKELRDLGAYLINTVHDEILIEAPEAVAERAGERLCEIMIQSAKNYIDDVPMSVDYYNVKSWYLDEFAVTVQKEFKELLEGNPKKNVKGISEEEAFESMCTERCESTRSQIYELVKGFLHYIPDAVDISYSSL